MDENEYEVWPGGLVLSRRWKSLRPVQIVGLLSEVAGAIAGVTRLDQRIECHPRGACLFRDRPRDVHVERRQHHVHAIAEFVDAVKTAMRGCVQPRDMIAVV